MSLYLQNRLRYSREGALQSVVVQVTSFSITTFFSIAALKVFELARTSLPKVTIKRMKLRAALLEGS